MEHLFFFKEEAIEVGQECHGYCPSCKQDTPHTVVTRFERQIRSVQCLICNSTHAYRPPRGDSDDDIPEPISVRRRQAIKKIPWETAFAELRPSAVRAYSPQTSHQVNEIIDHPVFGEGYVSQLVSDTKLEVVFRDGERILAYNRPDLPGPSVAPDKRRPLMHRPAVPVPAPKEARGKLRKGGVQRQGALAGAKAPKPVAPAKDGDKDKAAKTTVKKAGKTPAGAMPKKPVKKAPPAKPAKAPARQPAAKKPLKQAKKVSPKKAALTKPVKPRTTKKPARKASKRR